MNFEIDRIEDAGTLDKERLVIRVMADTVTDFCVVLRARKGTFKDIPLGGPIPLAFWFPNTKVAKGDFIVLYTKYGDTSEKKNPSGRTSHFFYWRCAEPIWDSKHIPTILEVEAWDTSTTAEREEQPKTKAG